jgi:hypothetical protein
VAQASPPSASLPLTQYGQNKNYYCGPASGYMILKYKGNATSVYNGASLSQANLAKPAHMDTDDGATEWASHGFRIGLNRWRQGSSSGFFVDLANPSATDVEVALTYDIYQQTMPFGADTVEIAGGTHYNGHPVNQTIGHWVTAYAYSSSGATGSWADPSTSVWASASPKFSYNTANFTNRFINNGITW